MGNAHRMIDILDAEIGAIADRGLTSANIDRAYKLVDMYKDLMKVTEYAEPTDYNGDSFGRGAYDNYIDSKRRYRVSGSADCKREVMQTLDDYMADFTRRMEELAKDADCREERDTIEKYIERIKSI